MELDPEKERQIAELRERLYRTPEESERLATEWRAENAEALAERESWLSSRILNPTAISRAVENRETRREFIQIVVDANLDEEEFEDLLCILAKRRKVRNAYDQEKESLAENEHILREIAESPLRINVDTFDRDEANARGHDDDNKEPK